MTEENDLRPMLRRNAFAHKGDMGHALIVAGSYGMAGAAILRQGLSAGRCGKVTVHTPRNNDIMQNAVPEAVLHIDREETTSPSRGHRRLRSHGHGPRTGTRTSTAIAMIAQLRRAQCPLVCDADALNMLAKHRAWTQQLPKDIIMTPHPKEFDRLTGSVVPTATNG